MLSLGLRHHQPFLATERLHRLCPDGEEVSLSHVHLLILLHNLLLVLFKDREWRFQTLLRTQEGRPASVSREEGVSGLTIFLGGSSGVLES